MIVSLSWIIHLLLSFSAMFLIAWGLWFPDFPGFLFFLISWFSDFLISWFPVFLNSCFPDFLISWYPYFQISGFLDLQIFGFVYFWISWYPDFRPYFQISGFPDFWISWFLVDRSSQCNSSCCFRECPEKLTYLVSKGGHTKQFSSIFPFEWGTGSNSSSLLL